MYLRLHSCQRPQNTKYLHKNGNGRHPFSYLAIYKIVLLFLFWIFCATIKDKLKLPSFRTMECILLAATRVELIIPVLSL